MTEGMSRRGFLRSTATGAVAAPLTLAALIPSASAAPSPVAPAKTPASGRAILIKGGCVLTLDRQIGDFEKADVLVQDGKIVAVRSGITAPGAEVVDASSAIVMPGFVDTHRHIWQGILRNMLPDGTLVPDYFRDIQGVLAPAYKPDDVYVGDLVSMLGAIDTGTTTVLDWSHIQNTPEHTDAAIQALRDSGGRAVF